MRSLVVVSFASFVAFALLACSSTNSGSPQSTGASQNADGGKSKSPLGNVFGGKKDAGQAEPEPSSELAPTCKGAALCIDACPDDANAENCWAECMKGMPDAEYAEFEALGVCINESQCETDECIQQTCAAEISNCLE